MRTTKITAFDDREALTSTAFAYTFGALKDALNTKGTAVLLGAGGSTPGPLYARLSQAALDWQSVTVGLTDERWVPADHEASNEALMRRNLLQNLAKSAHFLPMVTDVSRSPSEEVTAIHAAYAQAVDRCDVMILGMGPDAHTLSWFPRAEGLEAALAPQNKNAVAPIIAQKSAVTGDYTSRMTLTLSSVTKAKHVLLLITGHEKRNVLETDDPQTPVGQMIRAVADRLSIYWAP